MEEMLNTSEQIKEKEEGKNEIIIQDNKNNINLNTKGNNIGFFNKNQFNNSMIQGNSFSKSTSDDSQTSNQFNPQFNQIIYSLGYQQNNIANNNCDYKSAQDQKVPKINFQNTNSKEAFALSINRLNKTEICSAFRNQQSTIILQRAIMGANAEVIEHIIKELSGLFRKIIKDKNGNYFCSDLFKACEQKHRIIVLQELSSSISEDCSNAFATHPIQTLIDRASSEDEYNLILASFNDYNKFLFAALDPNGAYTIQKIIERIPERYRGNFNIIFTSFIGFISKKKFGIVVVKKFISCTKNDDVISLLMNLIRKDFMNYAIDQYANYLIQFLMEKWKDSPEGNEIKEMVRNNFLILSEKKYSSFICELFIKMISPEEKKELISSFNPDEINIKLNNVHFAKIMKALGIYNNQNNNLPIPSNFNNNFIANDNFGPNMISRFNFVNNNNFSNNNNTNNNMHNQMYNNMFGNGEESNNFRCKNDK